MLLVVAKVVQVVLTHGTNTNNNNNTNTNKNTNDNTLKGESNVIGGGDQGCARGDNFIWMVQCKPLPYIIKLYLHLTLHTISKP